jgi:hypothetical protein
MKSIEKVSEQFERILREWRGLPEKGDRVVDKIIEEDLQAVVLRLANLARLYFDAPEGLVEMRAELHKATVVFGKDGTEIGITGSVARSAANMEALARIGAFDQAALSTIVTIRGVQGDIEEMASQSEVEGKTGDAQMSLPLPSGEGENEQGERGSQMRGRQYWDGENHLVEVMKTDSTYVPGYRDAAGLECLLLQAFMDYQSREDAQQALDDCAEEHEWPERKRYVVGRDRYIEVVGEEDGFHARYLDNQAEVAELPVSAYAGVLQSALDRLAQEWRWQECFCPMRRREDRPCPACQGVAAATEPEVKRKRGRPRKK